MKRIKLTATLLAALVWVSPALSQSNAVDKNYEAEKAAEISSVKLQLATQRGSAAVQELNEAEDTLRRFKAAKTIDARHKLAAELEMAISRLKIAASAGSMPR